MPNQYRMRAKRRGAVLVLVAFMAMVLIAIAGLAIDLGLAYRMRSQMQNAADAGALAACIYYQSPDTALTKARTLATMNGFTDGVSTCSVTGTAGPVGYLPSAYSVTIAQDYQTLFVRMVGATKISVSTRSIAQSLGLDKININGGGKPGNANGPAVLSIQGPYAPHTNGEKYATMYLQNGAPNPQYMASGYDFQLVVPTNYHSIYNTSQMQIEMYDPDTGWNPGNSATDIDAIDGSYQPVNGITFPGNNHRTATQYSLYAPGVDPSDQSDDILINQVSYRVNNTTSNNWIQPAGWTVNVDSQGVGNFRINVKSTDGCDENGYLLRAGPPGFGWNALAQYPAGNVAHNVWDPWTVNAVNPSNHANAVPLELTALGYLPIHFQQSGTTTIGMGPLPPANGTAYNVYVTKFDTDIGTTSNSISYIDDHANAWAGTCNTQSDVTTQDIIQMPSSYPGGNFYVKYTANGAGDNSSWSMMFQGTSPGVPATAKLLE